MNRLTFAQEEILRLTALYVEENDGRSPYRNNKWFKANTPYEGNYVANIKRYLKNLGYVTERMALTEKGILYVRQFFDPFSVHNTEIRVQGIVRAGPDDDMWVQLDDMDCPSAETVRIPNVDPSRRTIAVRVYGESMIEMGILPGDYAIVELRDDSWWPDPFDLIVTKYLAHDPARSEESDLNPGDFVGPVIKVYQNRIGEKGCHLGWRHSNEKNPYLIIADALKPIGKVINIYRDCDNYQHIFSA